MPRPTKLRTSYKEYLKLITSMKEFHTAWLTAGSQARRRFINSQKHSMLQELSSSITRIDNNLKTTNKIKK